jgi:hypothetical protein
MRSDRRTVLAVVVAALVVSTLVARRRGYSVGGETVVRCRQGHLFSTIWVPGVSVKALRLGWYRVQYCPVGAHWALVQPVRDADLDEEELRTARAHRDVRLP